MTESKEDVDVRDGRAWVGVTTEQRERSTEFPEGYAYLGVSRNLGDVESVRLDADACERLSTLLAEAANALRAARLARLREELAEAEARAA